MILQCISAIKTLSAFFTAVATFTSMYQTMLVENGSSQEAFIANCAKIGTFACVALPDVVVEVGSNSKLSIATFNRAFKWLYALMKAKMLP